MERCSNCHRIIGDLETPCVWQGKVVCAECHARLPLQEPMQGTSSPAPYMDKLFVVRLVVLVGGLFWWPLLLVWAALGVYHLIQKNEQKKGG